jgi:predicted O-linked N-acetylglucosamine transferase (SPINDLY family)
MAFAEAATQACDGDLSVAGLIAAAEQLRSLGARASLLELYRLWLAHNAAHALSFAVRFNFAVALSEESDPAALQAARDQLLACLEARPDFAPAGINLGTVLERLHDRAGAVMTWQALADRLAAVTGEAVQHRCSALNQVGRVLESARVDAHAERSLGLSLDIDPGQREVAQHFISIRQARCRWPIIPSGGTPAPGDLLAAISPLSLAALFDDPVLQLANAHAYNNAECQPAGAVTCGTWPPRLRPAGSRLRIGYLSSDLRDHAVGYLTGELFELHDHSRVEVFAYYCGPKAEGGQNARFRASAGHWRDISALSDKQAAARVVDDGIDILVDVNGYTRDGRPKLVALRPAPCVVNWLGFPGTTGSPNHHYIIADDFIVPPGDEIFYSEKVLRLPCYQPNDRKRQVAADGQTRQQAGLPADAFVFSAFNGPQKFTPEVFAVWMDILRAVPGSVLWALCPEAGTQQILREHTQAAGVDPSRVVFARSLANAQHLARFRLADLFLDTAPYGAHTTASDALWMGLPVLTCAGNSFAARVCGSLVRAAGLPELVCNDWLGYRRLAIDLATDRARLEALKVRLRAGRDSCVLFDTPTLVRALEALYADIWHAQERGQTPVPSLHHLGAYRDAGRAADRPALPSRAALLEWYRTRLAYSHAVQALPPDALLWDGGVAG